MIIKAQHHPIIYPFFKFYTKWKISRNFRFVHFSGDYLEKGLPLLFIANHVSWWDGFWVFYLNLKLFKRKFHFMMLEEQLRKYSFFIKTGGYSVKKGNRSILESIQYTAGILKEQGNAVLLFPQGKIQSVYMPSFTFEKGIEKVLEKVENKIQIIFIVNMTDYFSYPKPALFIYYREYSGNSFKGSALQEEYNSFYHSCICEQQKKNDL
ncbi:MAG: lysophospholipid acyltransferase family protein [Bacteroidales bacterium]|nr:lysophospholipid acyltransferase family protein [Bacteroidales bacterium]